MRHMSRNPRVEGHPPALTDTTRQRNLGAAGRSLRVTARRAAASARHDRRGTGLLVSERQERADQSVQLAQGRSLQDRLVVQPLRSGKRQAGVQDDRKMSRVGARSQIRAQLKARHPGHQVIRDEEIRQLLLDARKRLDTVERADDLKVVPFEEQLQRGQKVGLIIDQEDALASGGAIPLGLALARQLRCRTGRGPIGPASGQVDCALIFRGRSRQAKRQQAECPQWRAHLLSSRWTRTLPSVTSSVGEELL